MARTALGYWVAYDAPGVLGRITHHTGYGATDVELREMLQDKEDEQARNDGREPRTVRVWPLHADDLASNKLFGLSTERMTKRQHEKALAQLATEGRLLPTTGIRREMHYLYNGMSRHLGLTTNGEPEPITGGLAHLIAMAQEAQTPVWYLRCNSEWRPIVMAERTYDVTAAFADWVEGGCKWGHAVWVQYKAY